MPRPGDVRTDRVLHGMLERRGLPAAVALAAVIALGWAYLLAGAGLDPREVGMAPAAWGADRALATLVMWVVMMAAMMLPSAAPMILLHRTIACRRPASAGPTSRTSVFAGGYLLAWVGFSVAATGTQWAFAQWGLLSGTMAVDGSSFGAGLLLVVGLYQLSPLKYACLRQCRSPLAFLAQHWRNDVGGTLRLGLTHGLYCLGCCWALMALLFVGGVMNLLWIAGLTLLVLLEKAAPQGRAAARIAGVAFVAAAAVLLAT